MRPRLPAMLLAPGGLGQRFALLGYRQFFGLRSLLAVSSVASGRIEFGSQLPIGPQFYGLSVHFQLLSTRCHHPCSYFQLPAGSSAREGLSPSNARLLPSARLRRTAPLSQGHRWRLNLLADLTRTDKAATAQTRHRTAKLSAERPSRPFLASLLHAFAPVTGRVCEPSWSRLIMRS
jgi:hypothetical protein